jgi:hypothetical protein
MEEISWLSKKFTTNDIVNPSKLSNRLRNGLLQLRWEPHIRLGWDTFLPRGL